MFKISPAQPTEITKLTCPLCNEKVPRIGLEKGSTIEGLTFKCKRCGNLWRVKTE